MGHANRWLSSRRGASGLAVAYQGGRVSVQRGPRRPCYSFNSLLTALSLTVFLLQASNKEAMKDVPPLAKMADDIKEEVIDLDDRLEEDFKAETISAETVVLNEDGKKMLLPGKKH